VNFDNFVNWAKKSIRLRFEMRKSTKHQIDIQTLRPLPPGIPSLPKGWLSHYDATVLYTLSTMMPDQGALLEVGSWIGRSSCCIAYGVRDADGKKLRYDIIDYGITGADEWMSRFGSSIFLEAGAADLCEVVFKSGGTGAVLKQNLVDRDLARYVNLIILGDLADYSTNLEYDFVFCDATHGQDEIRKNIPAIDHLMKDDAILVCDDIASDDDANLVADLWGSDVHFLTMETGEYSKMGVFARGSYSAELFRVQTEFLVLNA